MTTMGDDIFLSTAGVLAVNTAILPQSGMAFDKVFSQTAIVSFSFWKNRFLNIIRRKSFVIILAKAGYLSKLEMHF